MAPIEQLADKIKRGSEMTEAERDMASRILMAFGQVFYASSGAMFISGVGGEMSDGLPESVFVCPSFGSDRSAAFVRARS
jgi:F0F1-type ATP synthase assembly protein I